MTDKRKIPLISDDEMDELAYWMRSKKRASRRHHRARLKKKRQYYRGRRLTDAALGIVVNTPTLCSCWMCGNPRKYFGEQTIQERRASCRN